MPDHPCSAALLQRASAAVQAACPGSRDTDAARERAIGVAFKRARGHGLLADDDLVAYAVAMYRHAPNFDQQPEIAAALADASRSPAERWRGLFSAAFDAAWAAASRPGFFDRDFWQDPDLLPPVEPLANVEEVSAADADADAVDEIDDEAWADLVLAMRAAKTGEERADPPTPEEVEEVRVTMLRAMGDRARREWAAVVPAPVFAPTFPHARACTPAAATLQAQQCAPGELRPDLVFQRPGAPVGRQALDELKAALDIERLPAIYEDYLLRFNGADPTIVRDDIGRCQVLRIWWPVGAAAEDYGEWGAVGSFGQVLGDPDMGVDLLTTHRDIGHLMPPQVFIFASAGGGDRFVFDLRPERFGQVLFWSYLAIGTDEMFATNPYHNVGWVAHDFHDFINRMELEPDDFDAWIAAQPSDSVLDWQPR